MKQENGTVGVLYVATGKVYNIKECLLSAISLKYFNSDMPTILFTDRTLPAIEGAFDTVVNLNQFESLAGLHPKRKKVEAISRTPFDATLFLDADTFVAGSISEIIPDRVKGFHLAPVPEDDSAESVEQEYDHTDYNTGVMLFSKAQLSQIDMWRRSCVPIDGHLMDQPVFNRLRVSESWPVFNLDPLQYNFRTKHYRKYENDAEIMSCVKIFHMHRCLDKLITKGIPGFEDVRAMFKQKVKVLE